MVHYQAEKQIFLLSWGAIYGDRYSLQTSSTLIYTISRIYEHPTGNVSASLHCSRYFLIHNAMLYHDMNQRQIMYCSHTWAWDGQSSVSSLDRIQNVYETLKVINYFPSIILFPTGKLSQTYRQSLAISRKYSDERPSPILSVLTMTAKTRYTTYARFESSVFLWLEGSSIWMPSSWEWLDCETDYRGHA